MKYKVHKSKLNYYLKKYENLKREYEQFRNLINKCCFNDNYYYFTYENGIMRFCDYDYKTINYDYKTINHNYYLK